MAQLADEIELATRAAAGDAAATQVLLHRHRPELERYIRGRLPAELRTLVEPNDVLQDVCFEAFRKIAGLKIGNAGVYPWLVTIARNRMVDLVRHHRAIKRRSPISGLDAEDQAVGALLAQLAIYERTPSQSAISIETHDLLQRAMQEVAADRQEAIRLRYMLDLPVREIARRMNRTEGAIHMLCTRGLKDLKALLADNAITHA